MMVGITEVLKLFLAEQIFTHKSEHLQMFLWFNEFLMAQLLITNLNVTRCSAVR